MQICKNFKYPKWLSIFAYRYSPHGSIHTSSKKKKTTTTIPRLQKNFWVFCGSQPVSRDEESINYYETKPRHTKNKRLQAYPIAKTEKDKKPSTSTFEFNKKTEHIYFYYRTRGIVHWV